MHVALLNPVYWPEVRRGSERVARELADGLLAGGHDVRLVTTHAALRRTEVVEDGMRVVRTPRALDGRLRRRLYEDHLAHVAGVAWELRREVPDVAHALHPTGAVGALRAGRAPVVLSYMGIPHRQALVNRRRRLAVTLRAVHGAAAVVALSRHAAEAFERWLGITGVEVVAPPVDLATFRPDPSRRAPVPTILCSADVAEPRKRVGLLVEAFARVRRERPDARLVLSRPRRDVPLPDGDGVEIRDLDDRQVLAAANAEAWVAALPSIGEAFGLTLAEALACGTPVVGSDSGALPEVIGGPETGRVAPVDDDPDVLARALLEALELAADPATAAACRARAEGWGSDRYAAAYLEIYARIRA